jgi:phosphoglycolate phosphatase-like HAD superfamily hydrolase
MPTDDPAGDDGPERPLAIVDIDGVVADVRHRLHHLEGRRKRWQAFFDAAHLDGLHEEGKAIVEQLRADHEIVYLTGRPRWLERVTLDWLDEHGLGGHRLVMRPDTDNRPAAILKVDVLRRLGRGRTVAVVVDDDDRVIAAIQKAGYQTFQATWEKRAIAEQLALERAQEDEGRT